MPAENGSGGQQEKHESENGGDAVAHLMSVAKVSNA
jgi:hypothetical protein